MVCSLAETHFTGDEKACLSFLIWEMRSTPELYNNQGYLRGNAVNTWIVNSQEETGSQFELESLNVTILQSWTSAP